MGCTRVRVCGAAVRLGRAPSSVNREVARNGGRAAYRAAAAEARAAQQALRPKACKLAQSARLREVMAAKLTADWSPPGGNNSHVATLVARSTRYVLLLKGRTPGRRQRGAGTDKRR